MLWSLKCKFPKIWRAEIIHHDVIHILSIEEELLSFCDQIETHDIINRPNKSLKSDKEDSSKKLGTNIGC